MQPPYIEPIQPEQDNTLKQCMKLLACFHESVKHAEQEIKQVYSYVSIIQSIA